DNFGIRHKRMFKVLYLVEVIYNPADNMVFAASYPVNCKQLLLKIIFRLKMFRDIHSINIGKEIEQYIFSKFYIFMFSEKSSNFQDVFCPVSKENSVKIIGDRFGIERT